MKRFYLIKMIESNYPFEDDTFYWVYDFEGMCAFVERMKNSNSSAKFMITLCQTVGESYPINDFKIEKKEIKNGNY